MNSSSGMRRSLLRSRRHVPGITGSRAPGFGELGDRYSSAKIGLSTSPCWYASRVASVRFLTPSLR